MVNRILLADDSITIQKVVNLTFADEGIEVVSVSNGDMAARRLHEINPDLVLADIFMPGKNGYELCEAIKDSPQFRNVPVVLLVGAFEPFDQAEARRVRADAHMTKPFESRTLVETVRKLINSSAQPLADEKSEEERSPEPIAPQAFRPDFSALTDQAAPAESDQESLPPLGVRFDPEQYQTEPDSSTPLSWVEHTEIDTSAGEAGQHQADPLDFAPFEVSADESVYASSMASEDSVPATAESRFPSAFGDEAQGMVLDLDSPEIALPDYTKSAVGFDLSPDPVTDVSTSGMRSEASSDWSRSESDSFKTQMLEPPAASLEAREPVDTNPLEMPEPSEFNRSSVASVGLAEMQEEDSSSSTLLAVDDPLGDVLMDDRVANDFSYESDQAPHMFFTDQVAKEELSLEFIPQEQEVLDVPGPSRATGELSAPASFNFEESSDFSSTVEQEAEPQVAHEATVIDNEPPATNESVEAQSGFESVSVPTESAEEAGLAESGFELKYDSHPETLERDSNELGYSVESSGERAAEVSEPAAEFTSSSMWTEQETRFAPIDIEATSVDESVPAHSQSESYKPETGFEFTSSIDAAPAPADEAEVAEESSSAESGQVETAAESVEVPPALIDEIVRRVVSQMTESVVREIAWEVVPDVVERVIKEMAREEVSKRE